MKKTAESDMVECYAFIGVGYRLLTDTEIDNWQRKFENCEWEVSMKRKVLLEINTSTICHHYTYSYTSTLIEYEHNIFIR